MNELREDAEMAKELSDRFVHDQLKNSLWGHFDDRVSAVFRIPQVEEKKREKDLAIFGILLSGLGWFGTGYQLNGLLLGLGMGLGSILVMAVCVLKIENEEQSL